MGDVPDFDGLVSIFKDAILPASSALIVTHDFPDPDCLAAAAGLTHLLTFWGVAKVVTTYGGFVGRAENRAMVRLLDLSAAPFLLVDMKSFDRILVVDTVPGSTHLSLPSGTPVDAVFDHHNRFPPAGAPYFWDIRPEIGATSTLICMYLKEARCPIPSRLATALFYGIKTDTGDLGREVSREDKECYKVLFELMDHQLLSRIEHPEREPEFFRVLHRALTNMSVCGHLGSTSLEEVNTPDYVAEMADFFHSLKSLEWTLCTGIFQDSLYFSLRCKGRDEAGKMAAQIGAEAGGSGGGHSKTGAGRIPLKARGPREVRDLVRKSARKLLGAASQQEVPLLRPDAPILPKS